MPRETYTGTGAQDAIVINPEHYSSYLVTADTGTPVFTVQVKITADGAWGTPSDTMGTTLGQGYAMMKPITEMRLNISSLGGASEVYLDHLSVK